MLAMAPGQSFDSVFAVFADGILCSGIWEDNGIGLINARFFLGQLPLAK